MAAHGLECTFEHFPDVVGFPHGVVVDGGGAVGKQVLALGGAPFDADTVDFIVVLAFPDFVHEFLRQVDAEGTGQHLDVLLGGDGFQARNDGHVDARSAAFVNESIKFPVVKEHLRHDVICTGVHFVLQVFDVHVEVGGFVVLFGIGGYPDAEVGGHGVRQAGVQVNALVHIMDLTDKLPAVAVPVRFRHKIFLSGDGVAAQCHDVLDVQEVQVYQVVFQLVFGGTPANQVGNHLHGEALHDGCGNGNRTGALGQDDFLEGTVRLLAEFHFVTVEGYVDERRLKFHERLDGLVEFVDVTAFQGRH